MKNQTSTQKKVRYKKQCYGNFCTLKNPDCENCGIDDALDELETRLSVRVYSVKQYPEIKTQFRLNQ